MGEKGVKAYSDIGLRERGSYLPCTKYMVLSNDPLLNGLEAIAAIGAHMQLPDVSNQ